MVFEFDHRRKNVIIWVTTRDTKEDVDRVCSLYHDLPYRVVVMRSGMSDMLQKTTELLKHNCTLTDGAPI